MRLLRIAGMLATVLLTSGTAVVATGCSSTDTTSPSAQLSGTYGLRTVNGAGLPYSLGQDAAGTHQLLSDAFTFNADGSFTEQLSEAVTPAGSTTATTSSFTDAGSWTLSGSTVLLTFTDRSTLTGAYTNGNTITLTGGGVTAVYQK